MGERGGGRKRGCEGMGEKRERGVGNREARGALAVREEGRRLGKVGGGAKDHKMPWKKEKKKAEEFLTSLKRRRHT